MKQIFEAKLPNIFKIHIIPNSADITTNSLFSLKSELPMNSKLILLPASIRKIKDIIFSIESMSKVLNIFKNHYFYICGSVREEHYYQETLLKLKEIIRNSPKIENRIKIIDYILYNDFLSVIRESDLILNTSIAEGMSGSILEAMGLGVPVLVRGNEGNLVLVENNVSGLIFNNEEEFISQYKRIFEEKNLCDKLILYGKEKFIMYGSENEAKLYKDIILKVIDNGWNNVNVEGISYKIRKSEIVHQIMPENNELFSVFLIKIYYIFNIFYRKSSFRKNLKRKNLES